MSREKDLEQVLPSVREYLRRADEVAKDEEVVVEWQDGQFHSGRIYRMTIQKIERPSKWSGFPVLRRVVAMAMYATRQVKQFYMISVNDITEEVRREANKIDLDKLVVSLASAIEIRDELTGGHVERVAAYAQRIGKQLVAEGQLPESELETLYYAAILNDIGKIGVADAVINKPGKLTPEEWDAMKAHANFGLYMMDSYGEGALKRFRKGALHHEKMDGSGYPYALVGEQIPLIARIIAVADVWDALRSERPYRPGMDEKKALFVMSEMRGGHLDPALVDRFIEGGLYGVPESLRSAAPTARDIPHPSEVVMDPPDAPLEFAQRWYVRKVGA